MCEGLNVEMNLSEDLSLRHLCEIPEGAVSGIVDQDVYCYSLAQKLIEEKPGGGRSCEIERNGLHVNAKLPLHFRGDLGELISAACDQHQAVMIAGEKLGQFV